MGKILGKPYLRLIHQIYGSCHLIHSRIFYDYSLAALLLGLSFNFCFDWWLFVSLAELFLDWNCVSNRLNLNFSLRLTEIGCRLNAVLTIL